MKVTLYSKSLTALGLAVGLGLGMHVSAAPETYTTEANHTFAEFSYNHLGLSNQTSRFNTVSGTITIDPTAKTGKADITMRFCQNGRLVWVNLIWMVIGIVRSSMK